MTKNDVAHLVIINFMRIDLGDGRIVCRAKHFSTWRTEHEDKNDDDKCKNNINQPRLLTVTKSLESHSKSISNLTINE